MHCKLINTADIEDAVQVHDCLFVNTACIARNVFYESIALSEAIMVHGY